MKQIFFLVFALATLGSVHAQKCESIKQGKFRLPAQDESPEFIITRTAEHQFEENKESGAKMQFDVKWTSDCTYELSRPKVIKGEVPFPVSDDQVMYVKVIKVTGKSYTAEVTSNFFDLKLEIVIQILE